MGETLAKTGTQENRLPTLPDGRPFTVADGILAEPSSDGRLILWTRGDSGPDFQDWQRLGTAPHATVATEHGVCSVAITSIALRERRGGTLGKFLRRLTGSNAERSWTLPGGGSAEQVGPRKADRRIVWSEDESAPLDKTYLRSLWPKSADVRPLGPNLFLVTGIEPEKVLPENLPPPNASSPESPRTLAERALSSARSSGDLRRISTALSDLGLAILYEGDARRASEVLTEALDLSRQVGDPAAEADALSNLAHAANSLGEPVRAVELLRLALTPARAAGDRHAEKLALDRLSAALFALGDRDGSLSHLEQAHKIAAAVGDRRHEADILWRAAIELAEAGRRDRAIGCAESAIRLFDQLGNPTASWYAHHLAQYRSGSGVPLVSGPIHVGAQSLAAAPLSSPNPGLLRMALTATKAMAAFVGSGFQTIPRETYRDRLTVCSSCPHHTGLRCRICGCITSAKAHLLHERCPEGRWTV
jgi:tetratricopeptide (TPR) repeat protein